MTLQATTKSLVEVKTYLDQLLQAAELDESSNGLVIGGQPMVSKVGLAVNCSFQAIEGAAERKCDLLLTHHGAWRSTDARLAQQKYDRLRQLGLNLYVAHNGLDLARDFGTADALARSVQVASQGPFKPDGEKAFGAYGVTTGHLSEFVSRVGNKLGVEPRAWKNSDSFGRVAVVAGWGGEPEWMAEAQTLGCDTFLTGEAAMFGLLFAKEAGLNLILGGHYATEVPGVMALGARIARDLAVDVTFIPEEILET
ncbi:MAG TPA: Nif3-like dinuclear metal center hexameric protein [Anaerolineae bacterium]|nr:Nif3-like dinuclear metal center hexameric protein [Anaerolineae bacterium]